ncbi:magnesium-protoporphyrin O-methyltransferase [mine drainage metagenome]|uniref:Magnesium-protoporphyrin O-methyltransferase n=1 Tax=mine drainage metagenome TaxID=410659 RepID=A0A1J5SGC0_9ZZZZ
MAGSAAQSSVEALDRAFAAHAGGDLAAAEQGYRRLLSAAPDHPEALHLLGVLLHQTGRSDDALGLIGRAIEQRPERHDWYNDLGNIFFQRGALEEATAAFLSAIELRRDDATCWNNLGAVLEAREQHDEAIFAHRQAVALDPHFVAALDNLGKLLSARGDSREAANYLCRAYVENPAEGKPKHMLGIAYYTLGMIDQATAVYRQWLVEEPGNPIARHLLAACSGQDVPARAADAYVEQSFDAFADRFDCQLAGLSYHVPALLARTLAALLSPERRLAVLDAGCGTGLCGPELAPYARHLTGVDLSSKMLTLAGDRNVYDELVRAELSGYLADHSGAFDLIVIADTLIYFGTLEPVFAAAHDSLRAAGLLLFTVEEPPTTAAVAGYGIKPNGRYGHGPAYLAAALAAPGFEVRSILPVALRFELGAAVDGYLVAAVKPGQDQRGR